MNQGQYNPAPPTLPRPPESHSDAAFWPTRFAFPDDIVMCIPGALSTRDAELTAGVHTARITMT